MAVSSVNLYPLDPETFRDWLHEQQQAGVAVGTSCDDAACPLARFLSSLYGGSFLVHFLEYERRSDDLLYEVKARFPLPVWAERFAFRVDWASDCQCVPVSAAVALEHLRQACEECGVRLEG